MEKKSLSQQTADRLYTMIVVEHRLSPGEKLPSELDLSRELGVSRTTLREAIHVLASQKILEVRRGRGTFVAAEAAQVNDYGFSSLDQVRGELRDLFELRAIFEPSAARLACQRATPEEMEEILARGEAVDQCIRQNQDRTAADREFHAAIVRSTHNEYMMRLMPLISEAVAAGTARGYETHFLRKSIVDDPLFDRRNTKNNTPPVIHLELVPGDGLRIVLAPKGGGSENMSAIRMLKPSDGRKGVVLLAATNRPESLDPALTRPGRFDRRVPVELPDLKGREEILKVHARKIKVAEDVDFSVVARMASGASGAELANIVNEAALRAVRDGRKLVTQADLEESIETVIAGYQKKNAILTDKEKWIVSYHEIGHALVAARQTHSAPVQKITIIPRTSGALGYTMQVEEGNHYLMNKEEIENKIATLTGGRAAEEVVFGSITTGASNDIEQATKLARAMLTRYGMSKEFGMVALETVTNQYLGGDASLACSPETQTKIDQLVVEQVEKAHQKALDILQNDRAKLDELAKYLHEKETITGEEFMRILNG